MTIWTTSQDAANNSSLPVRKTRTTMIKFAASGLKPTSKYTVWCNDVDVSWACRTPGTRMGEDLLSDSGGYIEILYGVEMNPVAVDTRAQAAKFTSLVIKDISGTTRGLTILRQALVGKE